MLTDAEIAEIEDRMKKGGIPGTSIAYLNPKDAIPTPVVIGVTDVHSNSPKTLVKAETIYGVDGAKNPLINGAGR